MAILAITEWRFDTGPVWWEFKINPHSDPPVPVFVVPSVYAMRYKSARVVACISVAQPIVESSRDLNKGNVFTDWPNERRR
ncbi:hypothetical protein CAP48_09210 [Advenella sp. S44]|nr:hypothetical protein CAP48_09210 [Advenella sp. S44]